MLMQVDAQTDVEPMFGGSLFPLAVIVAGAAAVLAVVGYRRARRHGEPAGRAALFSLAYALPTGGMVFGGILAVIVGAGALTMAWALWGLREVFFHPLGLILLIGPALLLTTIGFAVAGVVSIAIGCSMLVGSGFLAKTAISRNPTPPPPPPAPDPPAPPRAPEPVATRSGRSRPRQGRSRRPDGRRRERPLRAAGR